MVWLVQREPCFKLILSYITDVDCLIKNTHPFELTSLPTLAPCYIRSIGGKDVEASLKVCMQ